MLAVGQLLAERYRLASRIAVGGMGEVWQAADIRLDRTVAVKVLKAELSGDAEFLHRFRTEARTTASLNHPGIASVHDYGETETEGGHVAYLVMELVEGTPLAGLLATGGRLPADRTLDVLEQAGHALQAAHERGLVHRDVKPGNILVTPSGQVKLTDFGIAKAADAAPVTRSGMVMGTAHYIAPEQALGHDAEPTSDVYSLAVCGYECLAGHRPFLSENAVTVAMMHIRDVPPPLPPDVPVSVRALIDATLVKDPRQRYANGGEFANAVAAVRAGLPVPPPAGLAAFPPPPPAPVAPLPPTGVTPMPMPPPRRKRGPVAAWVLLALVITGLIVAAVVFVPKLMGTGGSPSQTPGGPAESSQAPEKPVPMPGQSPQTSKPQQQPTTTGKPTDRTTPGTSQTPSRSSSSNGQDGDNATGLHQRSNEDDGMMSTPWMKWNGAER